MRKLIKIGGLALTIAALMALPVQVIAKTAAGPLLAPFRDLSAVAADTESALIEWEAAADTADAVAEYRDAAGQMVALMPGSGSSPSAAAVLSLATSLRLNARVELARITRARVDAIEAGIVAAGAKALPHNSIITFDPISQTVTVNSGAPASAFDSVVSAYGSDVQIQPGGLVLQSRTADSSPHWGGAAIKGTDGGTSSGCTSAFTARDSSGHNLMVTAGHCFDVGSNVWNEKWLNGGWVGSNYYFGTVVTLDADYDDEEFNGSAYAGTIYTSDTTFAAVGGAGSFGVGADYCVSGAYSGVNGATCSHTDTSNSTLVCEDEHGFQLCFHAADLTGGTLTLQGDSGAPWYYPTTKVGIRGVHNGIGPNCPSQCNHMYATPWTGLSGAYGGGLTIVTG